MLWRHQRKDKAHTSFENRSRTNRHNNPAANPQVRHKNQGQSPLQLRDEEKNGKWKMRILRK